MNSDPQSKRTSYVQNGSKTEKLDNGAPPDLGSREEPPLENNEHYMFLVEIFVHHLISDRLTKLNKMFYVPTCICLQFLHFEDNLELTPVDNFFKPQIGVSDEIENFYSGGSIMFAIDENTVASKLTDFIIKFAISKKMPENVKPDIFVGCGELDLSKHFAALRKELLQCWDRTAPPPKVYEGDVPFTYNGDSTGMAKMFVRMSAFGQCIVTEFDSPPERTVSSYIFKGEKKNAQSLIYKCRIVDSEAQDISRDSKEDLTAQRFCVNPLHYCAPCDAKGSINKIACGTQLLKEEDTTNVQRMECPVAAAKEKSMPETCGDAPKQGSLIQTSRGPGMPCGKTVVLKVSGLLDACDKKPTVTVACDAEAVGPGNPPDPEHDVFVLRIGKKGLVGAGEKSDIQLEMRTPKGTERGPPIRHETREMQTDAGGKGKKDKNKKKKKKK